MQGWFYRELRQSLVDMEDLFNLLKTPSQLPDGTLPLPAGAAAAGAAAAVEGAAGCGSSNGNLGDSSNGSVPGTAQQRQQDKVEQQLAEERRSSNGTASTSGVPGSSSAGSAGGTSRGLRLELRDVHFSYPSGGAAGGGRQVLRGVSLEAQPGESIAVVGELLVVLWLSGVLVCDCFQNSSTAGRCFGSIGAMTAALGPPQARAGASRTNRRAPAAAPSAICLLHLRVQLPAVSV